MAEIKLDNSSSAHSDAAEGSTRRELLKTGGEVAAAAAVSSVFPPMLKKVTLRLALVAMKGLLLGGTVVSAQGGAMTEVGTPRAQTLILDALDGRVNNPTQMNPYLQSTLFNEGLNQLAYSALWEMNTVTGKQFPALAARCAESIPPAIPAIYANALPCAPSPRYRIRGRTPRDEALHARSEF